MTIVNQILQLIQ